MLRLLIGYDGSECAGEAINELRRAGLPERGVEARVVCIADLWASEPSEEYAKAFPKAATESKRRVEWEMDASRRLAEEGAQRVAARFPGWSVASEAAADSPYWGLIARAESWKADLISLGSHGRSAIGRVFLGSVSHNVSLYATCGVRIGRQRPGREFSDAAVRVLIGWDGSDDARRAVEAAAAREWPAGSRFRLVTAIDMQFATLYPAAFPGTMPWSASASAQAAELMAQQHDLVRERMKPVFEAMRAAGLEVDDLAIREGNPKMILLEEADLWNADCVFVGARGLSRMKRVLLGSVSAAVAARARCSVEVVR